MLAQLLPVDGAAPITIEHDVTVVGRSPALCDIIVDHASVSKVQCVLARTDGLLFFRDLASTNGTRVNGQRAIRGALLPNDEIQFGRVKFTVFLGPTQPVAFDDRTEALPANLVDELTSEPADSDDELILLD